MMTNVFISRLKFEMKGDREREGRDKKRRA